jgi:hypothetical protein
MNINEFSSKIFLDRDRDGFIDTVDLQLHLAPSCASPMILSALIDLAASIGFETQAMDLPLAKAGEGQGPSFNHHLFIGLNHELERMDDAKDKNSYYLSGNDEIELVINIKSMRFSLNSQKGERSKTFRFKEDVNRTGFDLLNPFSPYGFYCRSSRKILPYLFSYKICLFSHLTLATAVEVVNFSARLGLESLHLSLPLAFPLTQKPDNGEDFIFIGDRGDLKKLHLPGLKDVFEIEGEGGIHLLPSEKKKPDILICGKGEGLEKVLKYLSLLPTDSTGIKDQLFEEIKIFFKKLKGHILKKQNGKVSKKLTRDYTIPDERKEIMALLKKGFMSRMTRPKSIVIQILMARHENMRKDFKKEIERWLTDLDIQKNKMDITVLNAYKPGLSWMKEVVLKKIDKKKIDRMEIAFKGFKNKGLEEPVRWLQEIFPIDEILAKPLSISKEKIEFKMDSNMGETYRVRGWHRNRMIYENEFSPKWVTKPYIALFPKSGRTHPGTGWVKMTADNEEVIDERVKTGMEKIWEIYQNDILTLIQKEADRTFSGHPSRSSRPIFEELRFDIYFDYPIETLGIGEERISPLEALHEEIYFVTLDFFSIYLKQQGYKDSAPGRVLPVIHPNFRGKNGKMRVTLVHSSEALQPSEKDRTIHVHLNGIIFEKSKAGLDLSIEPERKRDFDYLKNRIKSFQNMNDTSFSLIEMLKENGPRKKGLRLVVFNSGFQKRKRSLNGKNGQADVPMGKPIHYQEGVSLLRSLSGFPSAHIVEEGTSFRGLPLYSIENLYPCPSTHVSHAKRMTFNPTVFINCRHHANEVSSTNAGFKLSHLLATEPTCREILKSVNVIVNPMENVDGMVILEEMMRLTPTDKLHAGRYNQAGQEYYKEYFNPETHFGEAKVKPGIWERWLPDICIDSHGFPSHEWEQPFSGYAPFRFREWWIPRSMFFFYLPFLEGELSSSRRKRSMVLKRWIEGVILEDDKIKKWNDTFAERYWKYRGRWLKKGSPFGNTFQCLPLQKRFQKTNYSYCYPHITTADFITEVADEIGQGDYLETCISAHLLANLAILRMLNYYDFHAKKIYLLRKKDCNLIWYRERPLNFENLVRNGGFRIQNFKAKRNREGGR